jgi:glycosyltransferase involved in cell wall biosynthesis
MGEPGRVSMRIGFISGEYPPMQGGVGDFTRELARALARLGSEVHVITRTALGGEIDPTPLTLHPVIPHWGWGAYRLLASLLRRLQLDVLNIQYQAAAYDLHPAINFFPLLKPLAAPRRDLPIAVTFHDLKVPYLFPKAGPLREWVVTLLASKADATIVTNQGDARTLADRGVKGVARIPIGSNIAPVPLAGGDRNSWRARLGMAGEDCLLGFFGFFNARKGVETLIEALDTLDDSYHLLFIGGTVGSSDATNRAYAEQIQARIADLGLSQRVHYTGYVAPAEVSAAFAAIDLCVLPYADGISFHHGTLMAALAHGQTIISTRPALELEDLAQGQNVWLVPPGDAHALALAITTLQADPARRQQLALGAQQLATQFSWEEIATRTLALFRGLRADA